MRTLKLALLYLRLGVLNELQYRANFFVAAFQSLLSVAVGLIVLSWAIFILGLGLAIPVWPEW